MRCAYFQQLGESKSGLSACHEQVEFGAPFDNMIWRKRFSGQHRCTYALMVTVFPLAFVAELPLTFYQHCDLDQMSDYHHAS
jgi:hypothetical protein